MTNEALRFALQEARRFVDRSYPLWLVLRGVPNGTGKTHLGYGISKIFRQRGEHVIAERSSKVLRDIFATMKKDATLSEDEVMGWYWSCDLLFLDELGKESSTDASKKRIEEILNERYVANRRTVITTNLTMDQIQGAWPALASRMGDTEMCVVVNMDGVADYRPKRGLR